MVARAKITRSVAPEFPNNEKLSRLMATIYFYLTHRLHFNILLALKMHFPSPGGEFIVFPPKKPQGRLVAECNINGIPRCVSLPY